MLLPAALLAEIDASRSAYDLYGRLSDLEIATLTIMDWGAGKDDSAISRSVRDLECQHLVSVEAYEPNAWFLRYMAVAAQRHTVVLDNIVAYALGCQSKSCDVSLVLDVLEHLTPIQAIIFLDELSRITRQRILIWLPIGDCPQEAKNGNQYEVHQSTWSVADLEQHGYRVTLYKDFHTHIFPDRAVDAAWAVKDLG